MAKKSSKKEELTDAAKKAAAQEEERRKAIADFNLHNMGKYWIDPDRVPTDEDIKVAKDEFESRTKALQEKKDYMIADKQNAKRVAQFMKDFNDNSYWEGRMFVGVLNFSALMKDFLDKFDDNNPVDLVLDFGATQYIFLVFEKYRGHGINDANHMAEIWDEYVPIYEKLHEHVDWYSAENKACEELKEKWAMMEQGFFLHIMEDKEVDPTEDNGTIVPGDATQE